VARARASFARSVPWYPTAARRAAQVPEDYVVRVHVYTRAGGTAVHYLYLSCQHEGT
jgi:hypothetical protein